MARRRRTKRPRALRRRRPQSSLVEGRNRIGAWAPELQVHGQADEGDAGGLPISNSEFCNTHAGVKIARAEIIEGFYARAARGAMCSSRRTSDRFHQG
jgi:hypothetical protein